MSDGDFYLPDTADLYDNYLDAMHRQYIDDCWEHDDWLRQVEEEMNADRFAADPKMFEEKLEEIEAETEGVYLFPQAGKTKVRLLLAPERDISVFSCPVLRSYKGKESLKYMLPVLLNDNNVKIAVVPKTVYKGILQLLANGWDLFHPDTGHSIIIDRTGEGLKTKYTVSTTPNPVRVDYLTFNWYEGELADYARQMEASDRETDEEVLQDDDIPF